MTFQEIIRSFARSETVPVEAIQAALASPAAFVDAAILLLERVAAGQSKPDEDYAVCVLVHVLGEIGDERAFAPLMRVLALPPEEVDALLGDTITESLSSIMISLADDNAEALEAALSNVDIDDYARNALFDTWTHSVLTGKVSRERAKAFLTDYPLRIGLDTSD